MKLKFKLDNKKLEPNNLFVSYSVLLVNVEIGIYTCEMGSPFVELFLWLPDSEGKINNQRKYISEQEAQAAAQSIFDEWLLYVIGNKKQKEKKVGDDIYLFVGKCLVGMIRQFNGKFYVYQTCFEDWFGGSDPIALNSFEQAKKETLSFVNEILANV